MAEKIMTIQQEGMICRQWLMEVHPSIWQEFEEYLQFIGVEQE
jgi:hypothetical protein